MFLNLPVRERVEGNTVLLHLLHHRQGFLPPASLAHSADRAACMVCSFVVFTLSAQGGEVGSARWVIEENIQGTVTTG